MMMAERDGLRYRSKCKYCTWVDLRGFCYKRYSAAVANTQQHMRVCPYAHLAIRGRLPSDWHPDYRAIYEVMCDAQ